MRTPRWYLALAAAAGLWLRPGSAPAQTTNVAMGGRQTSSGHDACGAGATRAIGTRVPGLSAAEAT